MDEFDGAIINDVGSSGAVVQTLLRIDYRLKSLRVLTKRCPIILLNIRSMHLWGIVIKHHKATLE